MRKTLAKMKKLSLLLLAVVTVAVGACGAPFESGSFTASGTAGTQALGSGAGSGGAASAAGSGGAPDPMARAGASGASDAPDLSSAGGPAAEPPFIPPACSSEKQVTGGYYGDLSTEPACLRTKEVLNTIACGSNWDGRSITVNGVPATCGAPLTFPASADSFTYLSFGPGTSASVTIRWFLIAPSEQACQSRWWTQGDLYAPGEIMLEACDAPGSTSACVLGKTYAFSCSGSKCSDTQPGGSDWTATWQIVTVCG